MAKRSVYRRIIEKNRWLRSDGKPNFRDNIHEVIPKLQPLLDKEVPTLSEVSTVLNAAEAMTSSGKRVLPVVDPGSNLGGVVAGMDIIEYLGGGQKYKIVTQRFGDRIYDALYAHVRDIMTTNVISVDIDTDPMKVIEVMVLNGLGAVPVVGSGGKFVGMVTEEVLTRYVHALVRGITVSEVMSKSVISIAREASIGAALKLMVSTGVRRLPIVDGAVLRGVVTWKEIIGFVGSHEIFNHLKEYTVTEFNDLPLALVMTTDFEKASPDEDLADVVLRMKEREKDYALVMRGDEVVGIITERDVLYAALTG